MASPLLAYPSQTGAAIHASLADRTSFLLQVGSMVVNNGFVLGLWVLFFAGFKSVGGWRAADMALLLGLMMSLYGLAGVVFGGYRDMAGAILSGDVDSLLTQPSPVLLRFLSRDSLPSAWGDLFTGLVILLGFGRVSFATAPFVLVAFLAGLVTYLSAAISFASLAFWARGARSFARDLTDFLVMVSSYPGSIFSGFGKLAIYTVMPAGFVVLAPVQLVRTASPAALGIVAAATLAYALLAVGLFQLGLRRYRQGATPTVR